MRTQPLVTSHRFCAHRTQLLASPWLHPATTLVSADIGAISWRLNYTSRLDFHFLNSIQGNRGNAGNAYSCMLI